MTNVVNRVFDSSGPEGKVRGTPQQIIDKYQQLYRDSQLSGDRVAAENFQQHAEHYIRLLGAAMREQEARREAQEAQQQREREQREQRQQRDPGRGNQGQQAAAAGDSAQPVSDPGDAPQPEVNQAPKPRSNRGARGPKPAESDVIDLNDDQDSGLVETVESKSEPVEAASKPAKRTRKPKAKPVEDDAPSSEAPAAE